MAEKKVSQKVACSVVKTAGLSEKNSADSTVATTGVHSAVKRVGWLGARWAEQTAAKKAVRLAFLRD